MGALNLRLALKVIKKSLYPIGLQSNILKLGTKTLNIKKLNLLVNPNGILHIKFK